MLACVFHLPKVTVTVKFAWIAVLKPNQIRFFPYLAECFPTSGILKLLPHWKVMRDSGHQGSKQIVNCYTLLPICVPCLLVWLTNCYLLITTISTPVHHIIEDHTVAHTHQSSQSHHPPIKTGQHYISRKVCSKVFRCLLHPWCPVPKWSAACQKLGAAQPILVPIERWKVSWTQVFREECVGYICNFYS